MSSKLCLRSTWQLRFECWSIHTQQRAAHHLLGPVPDAAACNVCMFQGHTPNQNIKLLLNPHCCWLGALFCAVAGPLLGLQQRCRSARLSLLPQLPGTVQAVGQLPVSPHQGSSRPCLRQQLGQPGWPGLWLTGPCPKSRKHPPSRHWHQLQAMALVGVVHWQLQPPAPVLAEAPLRAAVQLLCQAPPNHQAHYCCHPPRAAALLHTPWRSTLAATLCTRFLLLLL